MKKSILTLSLMAVATLAANDSLKTEIDITAGYNKYDSASVMENSSLFGIRATVYETEVNKYGLQVGYEGAMGVSYGNSKETDMHRLFTNLVVDGEEEYNVVPYILIGLGYEYLSDEMKGEPSQGFMDVGVGFKYFYTPYLNVILEGKGVGKFDTRDLDFTTSLALGYLFGGRETIKPEPIRAFDSNQKVDENSITPTPAKINVIDIPAQEAASYDYPEEVSAMQIDRESDYHDRTTLTDKERAVATVSELEALDGAYYIQMAAYRKTSPSQLQAELENHGIVNSIVDTQNGLHRILVGPYDSKQEASTMLEDLKTIKSDAFIYHKR